MDALAQFNEEMANELAKLNAEITAFIAEQEQRNQFWRNAEAKIVERSQ